jgi:hypothetical protein
MEFVKFPKLARLFREVVITEKIDGTNAAIVWSYDDPDANTVATTITATGPMHMWCQSRKNFITPERDNFGFAAWCRDYADELGALGVGRHFGEWWGAGIQRNYGRIDRKFSLFNVLRWDDGSVPPVCGVVPTIYRGLFSTEAVVDCLVNLRYGGSYASPGFMRPEGLIVHHNAASIGFKVSLDNDDKHKEEVLKP